MDNQWISVKTALPKFGEDVLIADATEVTVAFLAVEGDWIVEAFDNIENVTHWMPLPSPPKEYGQEDRE